MNEHQGINTSAGKPSHPIPSLLETVIGAAQQLSDEDTKILQAALAWDVEDVETAKRLMGEADAERIADARKALTEIDPERPYDRPSHMVRLSYTTDDPEAWKGTPPAEGTRRALIRDVLSGMSIKLGNGAGGYLSNETSLRLADAVESALVDAGMAGVDRWIANDGLEEALAECYRLTGADPDGDSDAMLAKDAVDEVRRFRKEYDELEEAIHAVGEALDGIDAPQGATYAERIDRLYTELCDRVSQAGFLPRSDRDDAWVQQVVMAAITAGQECDVPFPADVVDAVLREFGVRPTLPRNWPPIRGRRDDHPVSPVDGPPGKVIEYDPQKEDPPKWDESDDDDVPGKMPKNLRHSERQIWERGDDDHRILLARLARFRDAEDDAGGAGGDDPGATIKFLEEQVDRRLGEREEARVGESRFAEERDCAFALLRWLLPVTVAKRLD